jgi:surface polysaccharide O-acyltransferase-like enzyme
LAVILLELAVVPLFSTTDTGLGIAKLVAGMVLVIALLAVGVRRAGVALFVPALVAMAIEQWSGTSGHAASIALRLLFFVYVTVLIVGHVLRERTVAGDTIAGAACAYLTIAMVWANAYLLLEWWQPGSFTATGGFATGPTDDVRPALAYLSVGMLTTVGSTIQPTHLGAAGLCISESVVGQLYLAIMIARLVGIQVARHTGSGHA